MAFLSTTDNNRGVEFTKLKTDSGCPEKSDYQNLIKIANTSIRDLTHNNSSLLVFPKALGYFEDDIDEQHIFDLCGNPEELKNVKLTTGNLMGFIGIGDTQLKIGSRFSENDENDNFLHYMLEKVFSINLFDYKYTSGSGELDLLIFLFPHFLKKALSQGLYRQYQTFNRNDANVKGVIDVNQHIKRNVPFCGKIAYKSRERTFDNPLTELIRHTIECIKTNKIGNNILNADTETRECIQEIIASTSTYNLHEREKIIAANLKPVNHPYFTAYKPLQKLCLAILRHKKIAFGKSNNKVYGILFDGAWLWEEYLATVLKSENFLHPQNKKHKGGIRMFEKDFEEETFDKNHRRIYPDFYRLNDEAGLNGFILDAKYKRLQNGVGRDDLYQVVTYMHTMKIDKGGFIYPLNYTDSAENVSQMSYRLAGYGGEIHVIGISIPVIAEETDSRKRYVLFQKKMKETEEELLLSISQTDKR